MPSEHTPSKDWLEQAIEYEQPFTITKGGEAYSIEIQKIEGLEVED